MDNHPTKYYWLMTIGAALGVAAAFLQTIEKLVLIQNQSKPLPCDLGSVFSCSTVLSAPQSSLFGFPNSLLCMVIFTFLFTIGLAGLMGTRLSRRVIVTTHIVAVSVLAFALWFLFTSTFVIGAVCIFCLVCFTGLLFINHALLRLNPRLKGNNSWIVFVRTYSALIWSSCALAVAAVIAWRFYL